jgi:hypothetical protein
MNLLYHKASILNSLLNSILNDQMPSHRIPYPVFVCPGLAVSHAMNLALEGTPDEP